MPAQKIITLLLLIPMLALSPADAGRKKHPEREGVSSKISRTFYPPTRREDPWLRRAVGAGRIHMVGEALQVGVRYATSRGFLSREGEGNFEKCNLYVLGLAALFHYAAFIPTAQEERSRSPRSHTKEVLFLFMAVHAFADFLESSSYAPTSFKEGVSDPSLGFFSAFTLVLWHLYSQIEIRKK